MSSSRGGSGREIVVDTERNHVNPFWQRESDMDPFEKGPNSFQEGLEAAALSLRDRLTEAMNRDGHGPAGTDEDLSIYTGVSGILLTYQMILSINPELVDASMKERLKLFPQQVLQNHGLKKKRFTFLCGDAGPLVTAFMISSDARERTDILHRLLELEEMVYAKVPRDGTPIPNELLYGRAGYLYSLLFLNQEFFKDPPLVPDVVLSKLVSAIIEDGVKKSSIQTGSPPLHYDWHDKMYIGAAHGYIGILYVLLKARLYMKEEDLAKLKETLDWVLSQQTFPSGNLRSSVGSKDDKLVHWCHGAPGAIFLFLEASKVFPTVKERYLNAALAAGDVVWKRGILKRSYSLCHGTAGNAYAIMALYKHTKDPMWLKRACLFAQWCFCWGKLSTRQPDRPYSLFEGLAGNVYMIHDFHNFLSKGGGGSGTGSTQPKFPAFELN